MHLIVSTMHFIHCYCELIMLQSLSLTYKHAIAVSFLDIKSTCDYSQIINVISTQQNQSHFWVFFFISRPYVILIKMKLETKWKNETKPVNY